jgi:hypothetical protein
MQQIKKDVYLVIFATPGTVPGANYNSLQWDTTWAVLRSGGKRLP